LILLLVSATALALKTPVTQDNIIWELSKTQVIDRGQTISIKQGTLTTGYAIEAKAKAKTGDLLAEGTFRLTLTAFKPKKDMPGQKAGYWYVQGDWTVTKKDADPASVKVRHNPDVVAGAIKAQLTFNPATQRANWTALAVLPMSLASSQWGRGEGSLTLNAAYEGDLYLHLNLWPQQP
jgi:hypothetical protein